MTASGSLDEHLPRLYRVALRLVGDAEAAQDIVQEVCVKALGGLSRFDGRSAMTTWLHRITVNCAIDHLRRQNGLGGDHVDVNSEMGGMLAGTDPGPMIRAEQRELHEVARLLVEKLPDECRSAFVLTQLDGYSYDEVAGIEGQPRGTIASRVFRAKRILMDALSKPPGRRES